MSSIPVICCGCGTTGTVLRVTANLACPKCASQDLDLWDGEVKTAASPGTGWNQPRPDQNANWNEYQGPTPGYTPRMTEKNDADDNHICPVCNGTGHDSRASGGGYDEYSCRNCHGTGRVVYPTENDTPSLDAHVPSGPQLGGGSHGHYSSAKIPVPGIKSNKLVSMDQSAKIMAMASTIVANNSGLTSMEAFELARRAVVAFPEDGE